MAVMRSAAGCASPSPLGRFTEAGQPGTALLSPGQLLGHRGVHEPGMHAEHANPSPGQFAGQRLGQPGDAGLGDGECRHVALLPVTEVAVDRDKPAAASGQHPPDGALRGQHRAAQVHRDGLPPLLRISQPQRPQHIGRPGAGDHQLRRTEAGINAGESRLYLPGRRHVRREGQEAAGGPVSLPAQRGQIRARPRDPGRRRALAGEMNRDRLADPAARAGHDSDLPGQRCRRHDSILTQPAHRPAAPEAKRSRPRRGASLRRLLVIDAIAADLR